MYRPGREYRTITAASYEVEIQKNGRLDVVLTSDEPVLENAFPMVWFEGEEEPRPLAVDGRWSTRQKIKDPLGEGQGMTLRRKNCEWSLRTYPTEPYLTVQVAYLNTSKKPVRVRALMPWCIGEPAKGGVSLGGDPQAAAILTYGEGPGPSVAEVVHGEAVSHGNLAVRDPATGRSLIAGFLTHDRALNHVRLGHDGAKPTGGFNLFRAVSVFDPPVEVPPKGRLVSEVFYLSVAEHDALDGLERYGHAVGAVNRPRRSARLLPHGWLVQEKEPGAGITEADVLRVVDFLDTHLARYGWRHVSLGAGWERAPGDWHPDAERFPRGLRWLVGEIHRRGMTVGLEVDPFLVGRESALLEEHPDWVTRIVPDSGDPPPEGRLLLDVTAPGAAGYVQEIMERVGREWGFDAVGFGDSASCQLAAAEYHDRSATRVTVARGALRRVRETLGEDRHVTVAGVGPALAASAHSMHLGLPTAPAWRGNAEQGPWGCVEALTNAARRYYFAPHMWTPDPGRVFACGPVEEGPRDPGRSLTRGQRIAWLTGAALMGGAMRLGDDPKAMTPEAIGIVRRLLPVPKYPARPVDLFAGETPGVWVLPVASQAGKWWVVALFNWDETAPTTVMLPFGTLGLNPSGYYTVFGFWEQEYYGTAQRVLRVAVPPGSVRLIGLRPYEDRPMFLATDSHFTQGGTDVLSLEWDSGSSVLHGRLEGIEETDYTLHVLSPSPYVPTKIDVSAGSPRTEFTDHVVRIAFHCTDPGTVEWRIEFRKE